MLDLKQIRATPEGVVEALNRRGGDHTAAIEEILDLDRRHRETQTARQELATRQNQASKEIGVAQREGRDVEAAKALMRDLKAELKVLDTTLGELEAARHEALSWLPNLQHPEAPVGPDESHNVVLETVGEPAELGFAARPHWELGEALGLLSMEAGARLAGSGFPLLTGRGARLQRALMNLMLDLHTEQHGYTEVWPPMLALREAMFGTGQLPKLESDMYHLERDGLFLIPTSEVQLANLHRGEILDEAQLPLRLTAFTSCFRREAGAAGKDTRGLIRVHQFEKVELVQLTTPETSEAALEELIGHAVTVLTTLGLTYRKVALATGDASFASNRTFDLELWAPGVDRWLEVSSCSNCTDFQARRAGLRYRPTGGGKPRFVHTLNGSGVALPRLMIALLETYQCEDGTVAIPDALQGYMGCDRIVPPVP